MGLADELDTMARTFFQIRKPTPKDVSQFKQTFSTVLNRKSKDMGEESLSWSTILKNIAIALTGIGIVLIAGKLLYSQCTEGRPLLFFQNTNKTDIELKVDAVRGAIKGVE